MIEPIRREETAIRVRISLALEDDGIQTRIVARGTIVDERFTVRCPSRQPPLESCRVSGSIPRSRPSCSRRDGGHSLLKLVKT